MLRKAPRRKRMPYIQQGVRILRFTAIVLAVSILAMYVPAEAQSSWFAVVSPRDGEAISGRSAEVCVSYSTSPSEKITRIELCIDGRTWGVKYLPEPSARGVSSFIIDTNEFGNGAHTILAKFFSGNKLVGSASSTCSIGNSFIDVIPPAVSFSGIKDNTILKGIAGIKMVAKDNSGEDPIVSLYIDKSLKMIKNTPPYEYLWNTKEWEDGRHTLSAYAFDKAGNKGEAQSIVVIVDNGITATNTDTDKTRSSVDTAKSETAIIPPVLQPAKTTEGSIARSAEQPKVTHPISSTALAPMDNRTAAVKPIEKIESGIMVQPSEAKVATPKTEPIAVAKAEIVTNTKPTEITKNNPVKYTIPTSDIEIQDKPYLVASAAIETRKQEITDHVPPVIEPSSPIPAPIPTKPTTGSLDIGISLADSEIKHVEAPAAIKTPSVETPESTLKTTQSDNISPISNQKVIHQPIGSRNANTTVLAAAPKVQPVVIQPALEPRKPNFVILKTNTFRRTIVTELRYAISAAGGTIVSWDNKTKTATAILDGQTITVCIGSHTAEIDGKPVKLHNAPYINTRGRTVVDIALVKAAVKDNISIDPKTGQCKLIFD